jgi:hypothetical protein
MALHSLMAGAFDASSLNDAAACTPCAQAAFAVANNNFPALVSQAKDKVAGVCGASFVGACYALRVASRPVLLMPSADGSSPATVQQTAVNSSAADLKKSTGSHSGASSIAGVQAISVVAAAILGLALA